MLEEQKKLSQPIIIGFDDDTEIKDPFKNKPALKAREKPPVVTIDAAAKKTTTSAQLSARSKSAKGTPSAVVTTLVSRLALNQNKDISSSITKQQ